MKTNIKLTPAEIAGIANGSLFGPDATPITKVSRIEVAKAGDVTFVSRPEYEHYLDDCQASCVIIPKGMAVVPKANQSFVECDDPYAAIVKILKLIAVAAKHERKADIHRSAIIANNAKVGKNVSIGARCVIGNNCIIANNAVLMPNVVLYDDVIIGENTEINSNVVCYQETIVGKNCIIHSGAVIGADGFGFVENEDGSYEKIPQLGNVVIGDDVEIGANTTIDRALMNSTVIENGAKIDNLVHIAHNCIIGENTAMAAQVGISGSSKIGKRNRIGGQVGISGHLTLGDDIILAAQSGVAKSIKDKGMYFGAPAKERMQAFKIEACIRRLPDIAADIEILKKAIFKQNEM